MSRRQGTTSRDDWFPLMIIAGPPKPSSRRVAAAVPSLAAADDHHRLRTRSASIDPGVSYRGDALLRRRVIGVEALIQGPMVGEGEQRLSRDGVASVG